MPTPTEPGWYLWRPNEPGPDYDGPLVSTSDWWMLIRIRVARDGSIWGKWGGWPLWRRADELGGEWGERLSGPKRLAALEVLRRLSPVAADGRTCRYCGGGPDKQGLYIAHAPSCPWLLAQPEKGECL